MIQDIFKKVKEFFVYETKTQPNNIVIGIIGAFSTMMDEFFYKLEYLKNNAFMATADRDSLFLHGGQIIEFKTATFAQGKVQFFGEEGATVSKGEIFLNETLEYMATQDATIEKECFDIVVEDGVVDMEHTLVDCYVYVDGVAKKITVVNYNTFLIDLEDGSYNICVYRAFINVVAKKVGERYNLQFNSLLQMAIIRDGIENEARAYSVAGGEDDESVEEYRVRIMQYMANPQAPFNKNNIIYTIRQIDTLKFVFVKNTGFGKLKIFLLNKENGLTASEVDMAKDAISQIIPAQLPYENVEYSQPIVEEIVVRVKDLLPQSQSLMEVITANFEYFFRDGFFEQEIKKDKLASIVYRSVSGVEVVQSFEIVNDDLPLKEDTIYVLKEVQYE